MAGAEWWGPAVGPSGRGGPVGPSTDAARCSFWASTVDHSCPECHHPTESHRLLEIAIDPSFRRAARGGGGEIYEVDCVVCQRQCCRTYG